MRSPSLNQSGSGGVFARRNWAQVGTSLPLFPAIGNHDVDEQTTAGAGVETCTNSTTNPGASTFLTNWPQDRAVAASNGLYCMRTYPSVNGTLRDAYPAPYYAFDAGNARFYILNTNWSKNNRGSGYEYLNDFVSNWQASSEEYKWLKNDLEQHAQTPLKFAFFHYPLYSDQIPFEPADPFLSDGPDSLAALLGRNGVSIAFSGHAHLYQRNKVDAHGLRSYTTGGGGAIVLPTGGTAGSLCSGIDAYGIGWDTFRATGPPSSGDHCGAAPAPPTPGHVYHYLKVTVDGKKVSVTPVNSLGETFDPQIYDFGPAPPGGSDGGGGGGGNPSPPLPVSDKTAPVQVLTASKTQDIDKLAITLRVNEAGKITAGGTVSVPRASKVYRFKSVTRTVTAGTRRRSS